MLFGVLTTGLFLSGRKPPAEHAVKRGKIRHCHHERFTSQQLDTLRQNKDVQNVGVESYAGFIKSTEFDDTVEVGLLWCDAVFWDDLMAPARTKTDGRYPQHKK